MRVNFPWIGRLVLLMGGAVLLTQPLLAQNDPAKESKYKLFFSPTKDLKTANEFSNQLKVRPNNQITYSLFIKNATDKQVTNLRVYLTSTELEAAKDVEGKLEASWLDKLRTSAIYIGEVRQIAAGGFEPVALKSTKKEETVATAPPAGLPPGKEPAEKPLPPAISSQLFAYITIVNQDGSETTLNNSTTVQRYSVSLLRPQEYLEIVAPTLKYDPQTRTYDLSLIVNDRQAIDGIADVNRLFKDAPAKVKLDFRPELVPGLDLTTSKDNNFETLVEPKGKGYELVVKGFRVVGNNTKPESYQAIIGVDVDGYSRAFLYSTPLNPANPDTNYTVSSLKYDFTRIDVRKYAIPGAPLTAKFEVFSTENLPWIPEVRFKRSPGLEPTGGTAGTELLSRGATSTRNIRLGGLLSPEGDLILSSVVKDWEFQINTSGIVGPRGLTADLIQSSTATAQEKATMDNRVPTADQKFLLQKKSNAVVVFDNTAPKGFGVGESDRGMLLSLPQKELPPPAQEELDACTKKEMLREEKKELLEKLKKEGCEPPPGVPLVLPKKGDDGKPITPESEAAKRKKAEEKLKQATTPTVVRIYFIDPDSEQNKMTFVASAYDLESQIDKAYFFFGPPPGPDNKSTATTKVYEVRPNPGLSADKLNLLGDKLSVETGGVYTYEFQMPDKPQTLEYGVRFINRAGLVTEKVAEMRVVERPKPPEPKAKPTTGTINGKVTQGDRPQAGIAVKLYNSKAEVVLETEADETGSFQFCKVLPGAYRVYAIKPSDSGAKDIKSVVLKAGDEKSVTLELKR